MISLCAPTNSQRLSDQNSRLRFLMVKPRIDCLPKEVVLEGLLPILDLQDLMALRLTNKWFMNLTEDDLLWKRRLTEDFNFSGNKIGRTSGWESVYKGLRNPEIYVWGCVFQVPFIVVKNLIVTIFFW